MTTLSIPRPIAGAAPVGGAQPFSRAFGLRNILAALCGLTFVVPAMAGGPLEEHAYKVLPPIVRGNLAIFPVLGANAHDASGLLTLDEGVRTGQVTVTEAGSMRGLVRNGHPIPQPSGGAEVNRLVLYNNSDKPLLLLAGEIVTGGKQDRIVGADRIVAANSGPIDLGVFCVEPGRWVESSKNFGSMGAQMAQPSVRTPAMAAKNQSEVWANVATSNKRMAETVTVETGADAVSGMSSYAKVFASPQVAKVMTEYGGAESEQAILRELRSKGAVGVVVAVNGQVQWADVFASTELLAKYWPKLMRSYVAEAMTDGKSGGTAELKDAERFIEALGGSREVVETEDGVFRRSDITGDGYRVFELTALLPKTGFVVHLTKMMQ